MKNLNIYQQELKEVQYKLAELRKIKIEPLLEKYFEDSKFNEKLKWFEWFKEKNTDGIMWQLDFVNSTPDMVFLTNKEKELERRILNYHVVMSALEDFNEENGKN